MLVCFVVHLERKEKPMGLLHIGVNEDARSPEDAKEALDM